MGELSLKISDNGTGFDPESIQSRSGLGILSMRERLRLVNGTISFTRIEPTGTQIAVRIPVPDSVSSVAAIPQGGKIANIPNDSEPRR